MNIIQLSQGLDAIVDDEDHEFLRQWRWSVSEVKGYTRYAVRQDPDTRKLVLMHRQIMGPKKGRVVDHINANGLDNRRSNLRVCTQAQNIAGRRRKGGYSSRFRGVTWHKAANKWAASAGPKGGYRYIGLYRCETAAALAVDRRLASIYGEYARLNLAPNGANYV